MPLKPTSRLLAARIRAALATDPLTREVSMFGGLSFMVSISVALEHNARTARR